MKPVRTLFALTLAVVGLSAPAVAQNTLVDLDTALRCSAAFGIVAAEQQRGVGTARAEYPPLAERGREFFVQTAARLMDERKLTRDTLQAQLTAEVGRLQARGAAAGDDAAFRRSVMGPCLALLDATIPAALPPPR